MAVYARVVYPRKASGSLECIMTADQTFVIRKRPQGTTIFVDGKQIGTLRNGQLTDKHLPPLLWKKQQAESHIAQLTSGSTVLADAIPLPDHQDLAPRLLQHIELDVVEQRKQQITALLLHQIIENNTNL